MGKAISRGFSTKHFYFNGAYGSLFSRDERQQAQLLLLQCTEHATTNWLQRYNATAPSSSRQHHARVTDPRCTVSSCFVEPEIRHPSYLLEPGISRLLLLFCFVRHKTQIQQHTTAAAGNAIRVWQIRAVGCRVALSNLRSVTHHIYPSAGAIFGRSSYMLHVCTWLPIHARGAQPCAFEVHTVVLLLLYGLKSSRLSSLPWQQCGSCTQPREGSSTCPLRSEI